MDFINNNDRIVKGPWLTAEFEQGGIVNAVLVDEVEAIVDGLG